MEPRERDTAGLAAAAEPAGGGYRTHVRVPTAAGGIGNARLLLALVVAPDVYVPDNLAALARELGTTPRTVSRWRDQLDTAGLIRRADGFLVAHEGAWGAFQAEHSLHFDRLPVALLRSARASVEQKLALAVIHEEAVATWGGRRCFVRSNEERAQRAGVGLCTVRAAHRTYEALGIGNSGLVRRGRCSLRRPRAGEDQRPWGGVLMGREKAETSARRAAAGRVEGGQRHRLKGGQRHHPSHVPPSEEPTHVRPRAGAEMGGIAPQLSDGPTEVREIFGRLAAGLPPTRSTALQRDDSRQAVIDMVDDYDRLVRFLDEGRGSTEQRVEQVLAAVGFMDKAPRRCREWARSLAGKHGDSAVLKVLAVVCDIARDRRVRRVGAVLSRRLGRLLQGSGSGALSERGPKNLWDLREALLRPVRGDEARRRGCGGRRA